MLEEKANQRDLITEVLLFPGGARFLKRVKEMIINVDHREH